MAAPDAPLVAVVDEVFVGVVGRVDHAARARQRLVFTPLANSSDICLKRASSFNALAQSRQYTDEIGCNSTGLPFKCQRRSQI